MPTELLKEFIGKVCSVVMFGSVSGVNGKILAVEENWIKVEHKNGPLLLNGDMIQEISILPAKYQK